jgi:hypothetical protein
MFNHTSNILNSHSTPKIGGFTQKFEGFERDEKITELLWLRPICEKSTKK